MNFAQNQALKIFVTCFIIIAISIIIIYHYNYRSITSSNLNISMELVDEMAMNMENILIQKANSVISFSLSPIIKDAVMKSNEHYGNLSQEQRDLEIHKKNKKWQEINNANAPFILNYTQNQVSEYLKDIQKSIEGEYDEIFVTDKYGVIIASTAKLTTLVHSTKYWWQGAYNEGDGSVFFDDRGYDNSFKGYVLGIVIPIIDRNEIIGIVKANVNIMDTFNKLFINRINNQDDRISIIRSGGLVVYENNIDPLSKAIPKSILENITESRVLFQLTDEFHPGIYAASEISITAGKPGYKFGGSFDSPDDKKGNTGETWYILDSKPISYITEQINYSLRVIISVGLLLSVILAILSLVIGSRIAKPVKDLIAQTHQVAAGNFNSQVVTKRKDEFGKLASAINSMTENLNKTMTSVDNLNHEITRRKEKEEALIAASQKWQTTFDASQDIIMLLDTSHKILQANVAAETAFHLPVDKIMKKRCYSIVHKSDKPVLDCPYLRCKNSLQRESAEFLIEDKWYDITVDPVIDNNNNLIGAIQFIRDISDRKLNQKEILFKSSELEKQLKQSEKQRIATLVLLNDLTKATKKLEEEITEREKVELALNENQMHLSSIIKNPVGYMIYRLKAGSDPMSPIVTHVSPSIIDMTGIDPADAKDYPKWLQNIYPEDLNRLIAAHERRMKPPFILNEEFRYNHPQKGLIWLSVRSNGIPYKNDPDNIEWAHGIITDITKRKRAEAQALLAQKNIKKLNLELEGKVLQRTKELEQSNKELEAFSYSVSHDLRSPLRAINSFTKILAEDYSPLFDEAGKKYTSIIIDNALKMGQLIDDLLNFSRIGRAAIRYTDINMKEMVNAVYLYCTTAEQQKEVTFNVQKLENIRADKNLMKIVWTNLISNAVKFSAIRHNPVIEISCTCEEQYVIFHVKDNGAGFDMKYADKLFGVFQRLHAENEFPGTGVGLALVKRIIIHHKGEIWAKGEIDKGAVFSFSLPKR